jgi:hypothetical protein
MPATLKNERRSDQWRAANSSSSPILLGGRLVRYDMGSVNLTRLITLIATLLVALSLPAIAAADGDDVIRDCAQDGDLDKEYSDEELEDANENMPSDVDAYTECRSVIRQAQAGSRGNTEATGDSGGGAVGGSGGGGGGSLNGDDVSGTAGATRGDMHELTRRQDEARAGTEPPAATDLAAGTDAGDDSGLPTAALVAIALLGLAGVGGGVYLLRGYLPPGLTSRLPGASR